MFEREKRVLESIARRRWDEQGPGLLIGCVKSGLILDRWIGVGDVSNDVPRVVADWITLDAWLWLRQTAVSDRVLQRVSRDSIPVVFCLPLSRSPHPEVDFFLSETSAEPPGSAETDPETLDLA